MKRKKPSDPRLQIEGWDDKEPTEVIDLAIERLKRGADVTEEKMRSSLEELGSTSRRLAIEIDELLEEYVAADG